MRRSQKTENKADRQCKTGLEDQKQAGARSIVSNETTKVSGIKFEQLVLDRNNLNLAYQRVVRNKGVAGIDGMTVNDLLGYLKTHKIELIQRLKDGTYKPEAVKRVRIPKPNGGMRKLGVPTVIDRLIQQAIAQVMSPIFERVFSDDSFGFRPNRSAHDAIRQVVTLYNKGYHFVVDLDLKSYFDTINHDLLIKYIGQYIDDSWLLKLIRKFLTSGVMNGSSFEASVVGTPQGGPLSPLLANIYLNELDKVLTERGLHFVRYADDCNIYVKSKRAGYRVLESTSRFLEKQLKVTVNREKSMVGSPLRLKFLGFSLGVGHGGAYPRPAKQAQQRVKWELKALTKRNRCISLERMFKEITRKMRGWIQYYATGKMTGFLYRLDAWLRSRIRQYYWKSWKKIKTKETNLRRLGMDGEDAHKFASTHKGYWRIAHSKTLLYTLTNEKLEKRGLINLSRLFQSIQNA
ncbi:group II intron reverse transcriptase/maturase [Lapidilactobacillus bayanensis]|uniref:group II intron reverse transcriptase/maturase n=1 Tax=Lapidilactobacillus bayanensis TaxID=2485998 RepID=UPI000F775F89|nr:group II intron reverse transcriptase/maturase [Lapidilactobacillus bayanensis]